MKPGFLLLIIAVSAGVIGYLELRHQAERETWRAEVSRLDGRLERAEREAGERAQALSDIERQDHEREAGAAKLAELEAAILDAAAELALLESSRTVARDRSETATRDLQEQVRALTAIETDLTALDRQRRHLEEHVDKVEDRLEQAEIGAAERQKLAETLDRDIAGLAMRRETLLADLKTAERTIAKNALAAMAATSPTAPAASLPREPAAAPTPIPAVAPAAIEEPAVPAEQGQDRGLYRFGSLSASPEAAGDGPSASPETEADVTGDDADDGNWAEDQYLLGLRLLANAEQQSGTRELSDAILAFKAVLGEWPKERDRMRWALARSDLGYALALLGRRESDGAILQQAVTACRDALGEFRRDETPVLWAAAQHHLGVSLGGLAALSGDPAVRRESINALERAIETFKGAGAEADAERAEIRLRETHADLPAPSAPPAVSAE